MNNAIIFFAAAIGAFHRDVSGSPEPLLGLLQADCAAPPSR
jgi:hypothetical protein